MDFTTSPYAVFPSSSEGWSEYHIPAPAACTEQEIFNLAPPSSNTTFLSPTTFPTPAASLLSIPSPDQTFVQTVVSLAGPPQKKARRFTSRGQPKPKEKELDPEEDVSTTAPNAVVRCRWGACTESFCAGAWTAHAKKHRQEMLRDRNGAGPVRCRWNGCTARLLPDNMGKHVRAQHVGTYEICCKYCGKTARADSYLDTHGLARDCPMRPGPSSAPPSLPVTTPVTATPALSPSGSSTDSNSPSLNSFNYGFVKISSAFPEESEGRSSPVLPLLAQSLRRRRRRLDQNIITPALPVPGPPSSLQATIAPPLVPAHPRSEPLLKPLESDQFALPPLVPLVPTISDTPIHSDLGGYSSPLAVSASFDHWRPFPLAVDWDAAAGYPDVSLCLLAAGITVFDASFVFDADATY